MSRSYTQSGTEQGETDLGQGWILRFISQGAENREQEIGSLFVKRMGYSQLHEVKSKLKNNRIIPGYQRNMISIILYTTTFMQTIL